MPILHGAKIGYVQGCTVCRFCMEQKSVMYRDVRYADFAWSKNRLCTGMYGMPILHGAKIGKSPTSDHFLNDAKVSD